MMMAGQRLTQGLAINQAEEILEDSGFFWRNDLLNPFDVQIHNDSQAEIGQVDSYSH